VGAAARKLAVIMHAMWRDGSEFRFKAPKGPGQPHQDGSAEAHRRGSVTHK
jgi:hypothetical protein